MQWKCCRYRIKDAQLRQFWLTIGQQNLTSNNHQLPGDFLQCIVSFAISSHCLPWRVWATASQIKAAERPICIQHKPVATARFIWSCCLRIYITSISCFKSLGCLICIGRALFESQSYKLGGHDTRQWWEIDWDVSSDKLPPNFGTNFPLCYQLHKSDADVQLTSFKLAISRFCWN